MVSSREFPLVSLSGQYSSCYYRNGTNFLKLRKAEVQLPRTPIPRTRVNKVKGKGRGPMTSARSARGSVYLAEDDDLIVEVPVECVGVVDEVPQNLGVVRGGHD